VAKRVLHALKDQNRRRQQQRVAEEKRPFWNRPVF
jgi:hypothetical protein